MTPKKTAKPKKQIWTAEEKAAMREHAREQKAQAGRADNESAVLDKIAKFQGLDRTLGQKIHAIVKANAPELGCRLWYGMPANTKDDKVVLFFQDAKKFKSRYATLGFSDKANLDDGNLWPTTYALKQLTPADEARIVALVKKAVKAADT